MRHGRKGRGAVARTSILGALQLLAVGCGTGTTPRSIDATAATDRGLLGDAGIFVAPHPDGAAPALSAQSVINHVQLPRSGGELSFDLVADGVPRNRLGVLLSVLGSAAPDIKPQDAVDLELRRGAFLLLLDLRAPAFDDASSATLTAHLGLDLDGLPANNFTGAAELAISPEPPLFATLTGRIKQGTLEVGPGTFVVPLPFGPPPHPTVSISRARLRARVDSLGLRDGVLGGLLSRADVEEKLLPGVAAHFAEVYRSKDSSAKTKEVLRSLFDTNGDGNIDLREFVSTSIVSLAIQPDVDTDGDGRMDALSIGVGFTSTRCAIRNPPARR
ncbi:MAG: hypothetical protein IT371_17620 [Deltaproteobacteria bacterium]|nr:hypothetical protein [Deltaproteobacteria bacterium]